jgi:hypothetical protein
MFNVKHFLICAYLATINAENKALSWCAKPFTTLLLGTKNYSDLP